MRFVTIFDLMNSKITDPLRIMYSLEAALASTTSSFFIKFDAIGYGAIGYDAIRYG